MLNLAIEKNKSNVTATETAPTGKKVSNSKPACCCKEENGVDQKLLQKSQHAQKSKNNDIKSKENNAPAVKQQLQMQKPTPTTDAITAETTVAVEKQLSKSARLRKKRKTAMMNKYVAMDCEMVGVGPHGQTDMLGRVSIVNKAGNVLLDKYVKPQESVTDYRTEISGIRPFDMANGENFDRVQDEVIELLQGKILVGHSIRNDLAVLRIKHPFCNIRDTARYKPLCRTISNGHTPSLKRLSQVVLGIDIQSGEHDSVEDARAAMFIYNCISKDWEEYILNTECRHHQHRQHHRNK